MAEHTSLQSKGLDLEVAGRGLALEGKGDDKSWSSAALEAGQGNSGLYAMACTQPKAMRLAAHPGALLPKAVPSSGREKDRQVLTERHDD